MCVSTGPTWGVRPHLRPRRPPVRRDPGPRWGGRSAREARVAPQLPPPPGLLCEAHQTHADRPQALSQKLPRPEQ